MANLFKDWNKLSRLWQGGLVPYEIDPSIDDLATDLDDELNREPRDVIENAIAHWEAETPVRFVPKTDDDEHWVVFVFDADAQNCNSGLGRKKSRRANGTKGIVSSSRRRAVPPVGWSTKSGTASVSFMNT